MLFTHFLQGDISPVREGDSVATTLLQWFGIGSAPILMPMWFVRDLLVFNILAVVLMRFGRVGKSILCLSGLICLFLLNISNGHEWPSLYMFGNFCMGMLLAIIPGLLKKWEGLPKGIHISIVVAYVVLLVLAVSRWSGLIYNPLTPLGIAAICSLAVVIERSQVGKQLAGLGQATFFVFCFHIFVISFLISMEENFFPDWPAPIWWLMTPLIYTISVLCYVAIKRYVPWLSKYVNAR